MLRPLTCALLAAAALLLALAAPAAAYSLLGPKWPAGPITYNAAGAPRYVAAVDAAARTWNAAGVGVRFARAPAATARVQVRYGGRACEGLAEIAFGQRPSAEVELGRGCDTRLVRLVAIHELGHVLGLGHERTRCARMNPVYGRTGTPGRCGRRTLAQWLAAPLLADDLRGARALYRPGR